jgi:GNAT superfamily N-acetyltransferase
MEIQFATIIHDDLDKIRGLQPDGWPDILPEFEFYIEKEFCHPIKAILNDRIVGIGTSIIFGRTAWLAHIIVEKVYRNRGIGYQITQELLEDQRSGSVETFLLIATESGKPVYKKAGFRTVTEYLYFKRDKPWRDGMISPNIVPYHPGHCSMLTDMDRQISGEDRRPLMEGFLGNSLVYTDNDSVRGFYLPELGEGLILALTVRAGLELMKAKYSKVDKAVIPSDNQPGVDFLKQNGFQITDTRGTRMILGQDLSWKPQNLFSRIGGNYG